METFLATLQSLGLYLGVIALGALVGSRRAVRGALSASMRTASRSSWSIWSMGAPLNRR